jgi:hypothetical protein
MHIKINVVPFLHVHVNAVLFFFFGFSPPNFVYKTFDPKKFQKTDKYNQIYTRFYFILIPKISQFFVVIKKKK